MFCSFEAIQIPFGGVTTNGGGLRGEAAFRQPGDSGLGSGGGLPPPTPPPL